MFPVELLLFSRFVGTHGGQIFSTVSSSLASVCTELCVAGLLLTHLDLRFLMVFQRYVGLVLLSRLLANSLKKSSFLNF